MQPSPLRCAAMAGEVKFSIVYGEQSECRPSEMQR
jgi:hypothetical protein